MCRRLRVAHGLKAYAPVEADASILRVYHSGRMALFFWDRGRFVIVMRIIAEIGYHEDVKG